MNSRTLLILSAAAVAVIWQLPYGRQALYPLTLLATFAHEMGHGLTALLVGAEFEKLYLYADGSGLAVWRGNPGGLSTALIAAGGLVGPTLSGMALLCSGSPRFARAVLLILAGLFGVTIMFWLRNPFGVAFLIATAAVFVLAARYLPGRGAAFLLHLIAVTLCLSWFADLDYMFSEHASVNGGLHLSDSAVIAQALGLPYWFWGGLVASFSLAIVIVGIRFVSRSPAWPSTTRFPGV